MVHEFFPDQETVPFKSLAAFMMDAYCSVDEMLQYPITSLRECLFRVKGICEVTSDSILCFGFLRIRFVIDAYMEGVVRSTVVLEKQQELKPLFEQVLAPDTKVHR